MSKVQAQCAPTCSRYRSPFSAAAVAAGVHVPSCDAFPQGIPEPIWTGAADHRRPFVGDHGLRWASKDGMAFPAYVLNGDAVPATAMVAAGNAAVGTGAMIALVPIAEHALRLAELVGDGESADQLHCTLLFLGDAESYSAVAQREIIDWATAVAAGYDSIDANGFGLAVFNPIDDQACVTLLMSSADLAEMQDDCLNSVTDVASIPDQHEPYVAHITLAYVDQPQDVQRLMALSPNLCSVITFDRLRVAFAGQITDVPLADVEPADESATEALPEPAVEPQPVPTGDVPNMVAATGPNHFLREVYDDWPSRADS